MTSIEWLMNELKKIPFVNPKEKFEKAKEMHKAEIIDFARHCLNKAKDTDILTAFINTQQYYQETFKKD
jgi:hypothetical protein